MAGIRGYHNYRGRTSKAKAALAVLLVLVILCAIVVMLLQRHIVYDETGTPKLELPWQEATDAKEDEGLMPGGLDLTIEGGQEEQQTTEAARAFLLPTGILTRDRWSTMRSVIEIAEPAYSAVAVTLKDAAGKVYFDADAVQAGAVKIEADTADALAEILEEAAGNYVIARISCFHDPRAANSNVEEMGLKNTGGFIFYDGNNSQWIDPEKSAARSYLCELAQEAAAMGFDEILLTDVGYPTEGKLDKIDYGTADRAENLEMFLKEMRAALEPYSVALAVEVSEAVLTEGKDSITGMELHRAVRNADRIYAEVPPEKIADCAAAVAEISRRVDFVPELLENDASVSTSCLVFG